MHKHVKGFLITIAKQALIRGIIAAILYLVYPPAAWTYATIAVMYFEMSVLRAYHSAKKRDFCDCALCTFLGQFETIFLIPERLLLLPFEMLGF